MIAVDAAAAGNSTVKVPLVTVLSPPKSMAQTAASLECESLKIKQPRAVNEAEVQLVFAKSQPLYHYPTQALHSLERFL